MLFRFVVLLLACLLVLAGYKIFSLHAYYTKLYSLPSSFEGMAKGPEASSKPVLVEFINYDCPACKGVHLLFLAYAEKNPDVRYVARPLPSGDLVPDEASRMAVAAGMQGKFFAFSRALAQSKDPLGSSAYRRIAQTLGVNYEKMESDAQSEKVEDILYENEEAFFAAGFKVVPSFIIGHSFHTLDKILTEDDLLARIRAEGKTR